MQDFSVVNPWDCVYPFISLQFSFLVVFWCFISCWDAEIWIFWQFCLAARVGGSFCCWWGLYLAGASDLLAHLLQATGKKNNFSPSKTLCVFPLQLCCCSWAREELALWGDRENGRNWGFFMDFLGVFSSTWVVSLPVPGYHGSEHGEGLDLCWDPVKHSWAGGGERNFPAHGVGDFPSSASQGRNPCARWARFEALPLFLVDKRFICKSSINPHGFIAGFRDGCVGALSTANKIVLVLLSEECAGEGRMWEFCLFWSQSLAPAWTLLSVCSFQPLPSEMETIQRGASPLPQFFLNPAVLSASWAREFVTEQEQSEALRGSGCSGSDF